MIIEKADSHLIAACCKSLQNIGKGNDPPGMGRRNALGNIGIHGNRHKDLPPGKDGHDKIIGRYEALAQNEQAIAGKHEKDAVLNPFKIRLFPEQFCN